MNELHRALSCLVVALTTVLLSCDATPPADSPISPEDPSQEMSHLGAEGSHPNFAFLEPLVKQTEIPDAFIPTWPLTVVICAHEGGVAPDASCSIGSSNHLITYLPEDLWVEPDRYRVDWPLEESGAVGGSTYRIMVRYGSRQLGQADVALGATMQEARDVASGEAIAVPENRTLPLAFHAGAIGCENDPAVECTEKYYPTSEPDILLADDYEAAVQFQEGWYDETLYPNGVTVIIEEKPYSENGPCIPGFGGEQFGLCHTFETEPENVEFVYDAIAAECMDQDALAYVEAHGEVLQLAAYDEGEPIRLLPNAPTPAGLDCTAYTAPSIGWLGSTWRMLAGVFGPRPLAASHRGLGGLTGTFSDIGWVSTPQLEAISALSHTETEGATLSIGVGVYSYHAIDETGELEQTPGAYYQVDYDSDTGLSGSATTGSDGEAWIDWTLDEVGTYTLSVTLGEQVLHFTATVEASATTVFGAGLNPPYPDPVLEFDHIESFTNAEGVEYWRWYFQVANWADYDDALFADAVTCGSNTNAARTWVRFEDDAKNYIYRFCDLGSASNLQDIWFGRLKGDPYPASVRIRMTDKVVEGGPYLTSNYVSVPDPTTTQ